MFYAYSKKMKRFFSISVVYRPAILLCLVLQISLAFRCARIEGLDGSEGILIFGREHFYILEGYTYNTEKNEIVDLEKCRNEYIPLIPKSSTITSTDITQYRKECSKFAYEDIKEVHKRRHILQVNDFFTLQFSMNHTFCYFSLLHWNYLLPTVEIIYSFLFVRNGIRSISV